MPIRTRTIIEGVLDRPQCSELAFITRALSTVGYRPGVRSCTIHDVACMAPYLLVPLVAARHRVWQEVERALGLDCELFVEFTGLISWTKGASIPWHHDANRDYLLQRHVSAVVYLNDPVAGGSATSLVPTLEQQDSTQHMQHPGSFSGGDFQFQSHARMATSAVCKGSSSSCSSACTDILITSGAGNGDAGSSRCQEPVTVRPASGRCVAYTADEQNIHRVLEVTSGERFTLAMWFTQDAAFQEDHKVLHSLCSATASPCLGPPTTMWHLPDSACGVGSGDGTDIQSPIDLRQHRLEQLGCTVLCEQPCESVQGDSKQEFSTSPRHLAADLKLSGGRSATGRCELADINKAGVHVTFPVGADLLETTKAVLTCNDLVLNTECHAGTSTADGTRAKASGCSVTYADLQSACLAVHFIAWQAQGNATFQCKDDVVWQAALQSYQQEYTRQLDHLLPQWHALSVLAAIDGS